MFDIGFWELMLIGVLGLVVLGPERLPVAIRSVRGWFTSIRTFSDNVKTELTEELRVHELHANLKKAEEGGMSNLSPDVAESVKTLKEAAAMVNKPFEKNKSASAKNENLPLDQNKDSQGENSQDRLIQSDSIENKTPVIDEEIQK